ncbi:MAG: hypothetical protein IKZ45_05490 [Fibrobacter sp.]|nr:hypothetical protein [Fibrobacter sp.]
MFLESKASRVILALIAILLLVTTGKEWIDFYRCGAVNQCLADARTLQFFTKFSMSFLLTVLAFVVTRDSFSKLDAKILRFAFVFSLLADFCFCMIKVIAPAERTLSDILGIAFFIMFQTALIHRHTRKSETDTKPSKVHTFFLLPLVAFAGALFGGNVVEPTLDNITVAIVIVYGIFVITSVIVGILAPRNAFFPAANAKIIRWGMVTFFFGDVLVGLALITGEDHSALQAVAEIANNFVWWVYVPAQLMLIRSTAKPQV